MNKMPPFEKIKHHYDSLPILLEAQSDMPHIWINPYGEIDWMQYFSPIEEYTWMALRSIGNCPLYPQYPALSYFMDFGNPLAKVGIECDGAEFHKDKEKDLNRDRALLEEDWAIFRISGSDCFRNEEDYYDMSYREPEEKYRIYENYFINTIEGLIKSISLYYFMNFIFDRHVDIMRLASKCLIKRLSVDTVDEKHKNFIMKILSNYYDVMHSDTPYNIKATITWL